jgi:hypothetical protein
MEVDLKANIPVTFSAIIKFTNEGYFDVGGFAFCHQRTLGDFKWIYVHVTKEGGTFDIPTPETWQPELVEKTIEPPLTPGPSLTPMRYPREEKPVPRTTPLPQPSLQTEATPQIYTHSQVGSTGDVPIPNNGERAYASVELDVLEAPDTAVSSVNRSEPMRKP